MYVGNSQLDNDLCGEKFHPKPSFEYPTTNHIFHSHCLRWNFQLVPPRNPQSDHSKLQIRLEIVFLESILNLEILLTLRFRYMLRALLGMLLFYCAITVQVIYSVYCEIMCLSFVLTMQ